LGLERPLKQEPVKHSLHADVRKFTVSGILKRASLAFLPAFQSLASTSGAKFFSSEAQPGLLIIGRAIRNTWISTPKACTRRFPQQHKMRLTASEEPKVSALKLGVRPSFICQFRYTTNDQVSKAT
jgi:hypothetical protein